MTIYQLKNEHEKHNSGSHFFDDETLKFFGESMSRMQVLKNTVDIVDSIGEKHTCYVVSSTRHKNAFGRCKPYMVYLYFDSTTFEDVTINGGNKMYIAKIGDTILMEITDAEERKANTKFELCRPTATRLNRAMRCAEWKINGEWWNAEDIHIIRVDAATENRI